MKTHLHSNTINFKTIFFFFLLFWFNFISAQTTISSWTFEPLQGTTANPTSNFGVGTSSIVNLGGGTITPTTATGMTGSGCGAQTTGTSAWALQPFDPGSVNEANGVQFNSSTLGYKNIIFTWDQRFSNTSPNTVRLQYTLDGTNWINFIMTTGNTTYCLGSINVNGCFETDSTGDNYRRISVDFSAITAINNNPNFGLRILDSYYQSTTEFRQTNAPSTVAGTTGTWRFDNVTFSGTLLPGPTALTMTASAPTTFCAGGSTNLYVAITGGTGPFTLTYHDSISGDIVINNYVSGTAIPITPSSTRTYSIVSVANANGQLGTGISGTPNITVNQLPTITTAATTLSPYKCFSASAQNTTLAYSATSLLTAASTYSITWNASPANSFAPVTNATIPSVSASTITINIPANTAGGTYTGTITVKNTTCTSAPKNFTLTINPQTTITNQPSTIAQTTCSGGTFSPISVVATGATGLTYQWYVNYQNTTSGGTALTSGSFPSEFSNGSTTATYTPLTTTVMPGHVQSFYYYYVIISGSCTAVKSTSSGSFTVTSPSVSGNISSPQTICSGTIPNDLVLSGNTGNILKWQRANDSGFTSGVIDIANTTNTLLGSAIGALNQTTYFRAFVQSGSCATAITSGIQILIKTTTWNGAWDNGIPDSSTTVIFDADYDSVGDLNACSVRINSGDVTFHSGHSLIIQNSLDTSGGTLTFDNNASLVQVNNSSNIGNISYIRNTTPMVTFDYTYWSSPVSTQEIHTFSPSTLTDKYFEWNTSIYNWSVIPAAPPYIMVPGRGYIIRAPQGWSSTPTIWSGQFYGIPNNGDVSATIAVAGANDLNLIGNPYPCSLNAYSFLNNVSNSSIISGSIYFWTHNTPITSNNYNSNDYATYNLLGGVGTHATNSGINNYNPNGHIAAGEAFFVEGITNGNVTFKNNMREIGNNNQFFKNINNNTTYQGNEKHRLWLEISDGNGMFKQMLLGYAQNATNGKDYGYDSKWLDSGNPINIYTELNTDKLTIKTNGLPFNNQDVHIIGYTAPIAGNFEINLPSFDGLFLNQNIYLEDKLLGVLHDLKLSPYSFASDAGDFDNRFVLRFTDTTLSNNNFEFDQSNLIVYKNNNQLVINSGMTIMSDVKIFDVTGRLIFEKNNLNKSDFKLDLETSNQVLIIQIKSIDGKTISKKIMN